MTCQFPFEGLRKKMLTVKGSGCVALGHPVTSAENWLLEEDDRSMADGGFGTAPALLLLQPLAQTATGCVRRRRHESGTNGRRRYPRILRTAGILSVTPSREFERQERKCLRPWRDAVSA